MNAPAARPYQYGYVTDDLDRDEMGFAKVRGLRFQRLPAVDRESEGGARA